MVRRAVVICGSLSAAKNRITGTFRGVFAPVWDNVKRGCAWSVLLCWDFFLFSFLRIIGLFVACMCCWNLIWCAIVLSLLVLWHLLCRQLERLNTLPLGNVLASVCSCALWAGMDGTVRNSCFGDRSMLFHSHFSWGAPQAYPRAVSAPAMELCWVGLCYTGRGCCAPWGRDFGSLSSLTESCPVLCVPEPCLLKPAF